MTNDKPYSVACERNQAFILKQLKKLLPNKAKVLEIGSGTGQHAVFFGKARPDITWQTSDLEALHSGIKKWLADADIKNILPPLSLNVDKDHIVNHDYDMVFTANTFHIMSLESVENCILKASQALNPMGLLVIYGPFKFDGKFTSQSNEAFDHFLKNNGAQQGIRDFEIINAYASATDLKHQEIIAMPANNVLLVFIKS